MKECRKKYEREHGKPAPEPKVEAPVGKGLGSKAWAEFNEAQEEGWQETLEPCPQCGRTFLPDRLAVHLRSCGGGSGGGGGRSGTPEPGSRSERDKTKKPNLPLCHLCGRQFGSSSLEIHLKEYASRPR